MTSPNRHDWLPYLVFPPLALCAGVLAVSSQFQWLTFLFLAVYPALAAMILLVAGRLIPSFRMPLPSALGESVRVATVFVSLSGALRLMAFGPRFASFDIPLGSETIRDFGHLWLQPTFLLLVWAVMVAAGVFWFRPLR